MTTIFDLAVQMGRINRWAGKGAFAISIAQHQAVLSYYVPPALARAALVHDISETIIGGDVIDPIKRRCPELIAIEEDYQRRICEAFEVPFLYLARLHPYDVAIRDDERRVLWLNRPCETDGLGAVFEPMTPLEATHAWLERYYALYLNELPTLEIMP